MEQTRTLIAIALSILVFIIWSKFAAPPVEPIPSQDAKTTESVNPNSEKPVVSNIQPQKPVEKPIINAEIQPVSNTARQIEIKTALYSVTLSEKNAAIVEMVLNDYKESVGPGAANKKLISLDDSGGSYILSTTGNDSDDIGNAVYVMDESRDRIEVRESPIKIKFIYQRKDGLQIEKIYSFFRDSYLIGMHINLFNGTNSEFKDNIVITLRNKTDLSKQGYAFEGPSGLIGKNIKQLSIKDIDNNVKGEGNIHWVANETRYFMTGIIPKLEAGMEGQMVVQYKDLLLTNQLIIKNSALDVQRRAEYTFDLFMGPKNLEILKGFNNHLDKAIDFGWFEFIAKPCLWFMNLTYRAIPNYGVAIIILTIITRLAFWPLAAKSYKSMNEMRKLQPLMMEIREKYKNDKNRMNQEIMGLYRTYKVNPVGGCLPTLIQLPVFFALYQMLYKSIELRHAPFMGWINDLSAPDRLFDFGVSIPLMEAPYGIPVLTLIMGASMFIQQKMSPPPGDPTQAKMMMFLPVVFTFIFINFPSGLVLYWLVSNMVSIAQQYYSQKKLV
jgi:YidC/Oxa1 family membrane protein insertase